MKYYHITDTKNSPDISFSGLKANTDGDIFIFTAWEVEVNGASVLLCDLIARNQTGHEEFLIVEINPKGIKVKLIDDNVGELTAKFQKIVKQPVIARSYCKVVGSRKIDFERLENFNRALYKQLI